MEDNTVCEWRYQSAKLCTNRQLQILWCTDASQPHSERDISSHCLHTITQRNMGDVNNCSSYYYAEKVGKHLWFQADRPNELCKGKAVNGRTCQACKNVSLWCNCRQHEGRYLSSSGGMQLHKQEIDQTQWCKWCKPDGSSSTNVEEGPRKMEVSSSYQMNLPPCKEN